MKTIEEQIGGKCIHFNGIMNKACKCGINYEQVFGERPVMRMPCIKDRMEHLTDDVIPCEKLEFPTPEEVKRQVEEGNKSVSFTIIALMKVKKHIKETGESQGSIKCPNGDHNLNYARAESNGHVWMSCKDCGISMME